MLSDNKSRPISRLSCEFREGLIMKIEEYYDGLAFYTEDGEYEIAFYSKITDRVRYSEKMAINIGRVLAILKFLMMITARLWRKLKNIKEV